MENFKTSFDKMLDKFNESVTHSAPKKLNFEYLNDSVNSSGTVPKKRRYCSSQEEDNLNTSNGGNAANGSSTSSNNTNSFSLPSSPWETRRMRADLIEAKSRITHLKLEIDRQQKLRAEMETLYDSKVTELKKQCDYSSNKVIDVEKHLQTVRKREHGARQELTRVQNELAQQKLSFEEIILKLEKDKLETEDCARQVQNSLTNELSEYRRHTDKIEMELNLVTEELTSVKKQLNDSKAHAAAYDELKMEHEKEHQDLESANSRIKELEHEIANYIDWKEITSKSQTRLLSLNEMDQELQSLRANNKHLHELLGNKLLLEEQVHVLSTRLEKEDGAKTELIALQTKFAYVEQELKEWIKVAQDHCLPNMLVSPIALRARIEQLLQNDIIMVSERTTKTSETKALETEVLDYKKKSEIYAKNVEELNVALKKHKIFKERLQKKLFVISKERDCYKQLLDNFEKDITLCSASTSEQTNSELQLRCRVDMLEKTLLGYKDMCVNLEKELTHSKQLTNTEQAFENIEGYEHIKKELDTLRLENEQLRRRKEELELELEHRCLKGDFQINKYKVVHFSQNPAAEAYINSSNFIEKLQAEIERLKRRNQKLEEDNEVTQARLNETSNMTINIKEMNQMRTELESTNAKLKKLKEIYKSANMEFRDVCYMLFGYRIDHFAHNSSYRISSMYAENAEDYLQFCLNDQSSNLVMVETGYSVTLQPFIEAHLNTTNSLPAFLSALTLELFQRSTVTIS